MLDEKIFLKRAAQLFSDQNLRAAMGKKNRNRTLEIFSFNETANRYKAIIREFIN
jgi:hypothetical protein